uniref:Tudor domain containing 15 n=1 Tax=Myripristis murdjan TaxID=586833 RepID=A0A667YMX4_9TELE
MSEKLARACESRTEDPCQKPPDNLGQLCSVKGKDEKWYRGFVQFLPVNSQVRVLFVDYGFCESVKVENIQRLPPDFHSPAIMAFPCSLSSLTDQDKAVKTQQLAFLKSGLLGRVLEVEISSYDEQQNLYSITVLSVKDGHKKDIGLKPIQELPKIKIEMALKTGQMAPQNSCYETLLAQAFAKTVQAEKVHMDSPVVGYVEYILNPSHFWIRTQKRCEFGIRCSHISSPSDFWCQILNKVPALEELMGRIQQYYTMHTVPIQQGVSYCVARSPVDGRWYRACIKGRQNGHVEVILVDYGMTLQIKEHNLQTILAEHLEPEGQAFRCSLTNMIEPTDPKRLYNVVDLYDAETQQSITNMLVEKGLAREVKISTQLLSTVCPDSFIYSSFNLSAGKEEQVYISHVSSPGEVYCQLERNTDTIEDLQKKVSVESEKIMMTQDDTRAVVGKLCLAKYFDGKWYRGLACPVPSPQHLSVFFVDYGNASIFEKNNVIFIPRDSIDLLCTPMQAVRCSLAGVLKEDVYAEVNEWLDEAILNKQVRALVKKQKTYMYTKNM